MTEVYPPLEYRQKWLDFRRDNNPAMYAKPLTVEATRLRDALIQALWDGECSFEQTSLAIQAAVDSLIANGAWGPGAPQ